mmetsp:Transcript_9017/g.13175  ORF Transcript_9017/g.13175 Transcript_9017/m.13175 type:complete len:145 (-) Transcript_9017:18-452(-)|eukprot:CAMPEP_0194071644 /NCGR_PEP_ID=MMETSP0009_2-20130614/88819_1 /TAXON_ID=210454 /ORGANISM="Grammatophora oceanica, Strain CCMP 410" /LENGTH=144 /DNA_ID=CAMNT_0038724983 /DNA_START=218 /DNA_END=652 /DNA_ORIENTATION=+
MNEEGTASANVSGADSIIISRDAQNAPATLYGPFHRLKSPTQTMETAQQQLSSNEIWGKPRRSSDIPQVQCYQGELADDAEGIEFFTPTAPDAGVAPGQARWTGPREGVKVEDDFAKIHVRITKTRYMDGSGNVSEVKVSQKAL